MLCVKMFLHSCVIFGFLSRASTQSTTALLPRFCIEDACYIKIYGAQKNWTIAQEKCNRYGSTLPLVSDPVQQRNFEAACRNLSTSYDMDRGIWIGARAFSNDPINWTWLDGSIYNGTDIPSQREYYASYSYVVNTSAGVLAYASPPTNDYSYICYYPTQAAQCVNGTGQTAFYIGSRYYVKYDAKKSWFGARNNCLSNNGDLASFTQLSLLDGKIDSNEVWIGLRNTQWKWQNLAHGLSDVTFTLWSSDQPNDAVPSCISTDGDDKFPGWKDWNCTKELPFICQENMATSTTSSTSSATPTTAMCSLTNALTSQSSSSATPTNPSSSIATPTNPSSLTATPTNPSSLTATPTNPSSLTATPSNPSSSTTEENISSTHPTDNRRNDSGHVNIALAVGLGVGIGVPVIILIVALVIILIIVLRKRQSSSADGNSQSRNKSESKNSLNNTEPETSEMNEMENGRTVAGKSTTQYVTVERAMDLDQGAKLPSNQRIVYEPLSFNPASD